MRARIHGAIVVRPIKFPDDLDLRLFPLRIADGTQIAEETWPMEEHRSWDWVKKQYRVTSDAEPRIKPGESITVFVGTIIANFPQGTEFPEGSEVEILDP